MTDFLFTFVTKKRQNEYSPEEIMTEINIRKAHKDSMFAHLKETEAGEFYLDSVGVLDEYRP